MFVYVHEIKNLHVPLKKGSFQVNYL